MNDTRKRLMILLREIYDDRDFVCGAVCNAVNEKQWKKMITFIEEARNAGRLPTSDDILALSVILGEEADAEKQVVGYAGRRVAVF